jgi:hypothetical protein
MEDLGYQVFKLSTGKMFCPRNSLLFLYEVKKNDGGNPGDFMYEVADGYNNAADLTKDEVKEVAEYMAKMWTEFANSLK